MRNHTVLKRSDSESKSDIQRRLDAALERNQQLEAELKLATKRAADAELKLRRLESSQSGSSLFRRRSPYQEVFAGTKITKPQRHQRSGETKQPSQPNLAIQTPTPNAQPSPPVLPSHTDTDPELVALEASLVAHPENRYELFGELLYTRVSALDNVRAGKITGAFRSQYL